MTKIIVRIPTETYAYIELEYDSREDYEKNYPIDALTISKTRAETKELVEKEMAKTKWEKDKKTKETEAPF